MLISRGSPIRTGRAARGRSTVSLPARCTVFGWVFLLSGALTADRIVRLNGSVIDDVTIVDARWDLVQYQVGGRGRAQSIPGDQVASIDRDAPGSLLERGRNEAAQGDYKDAIKTLKSAESSSPKDWQKAEAAYRQGEVLLDSGDDKAAEEQFKAYLKEHDKSKDWWVPHALYSLGKAQIDQEHYESAADTFKKLEDMPGQWSLRAQVGRARTVEASNNTGKFLEARQLLLSVARGRTTPPELKDEAYVVRSWIFLRQKQYGEAIKELQAEFFDPSKAREYRYDARRAEATYLMGRAYGAMGGKENLEQAELWLLRVPALYPNRGRVYTAACKALAVVYRDLGNTERAAEWVRRGRDDE